MTDWKQLLNDFVADVNQNPNLTDEELQEAYPELNNGSLLDAAWSYRNTLNTKKYDEATLQSKFPEFFSGNGTPQEKSLIQPVEANNPYLAPTVQGRSLKAEEVIRPEDYEDGFVPTYQNQTIKPQTLQHRKDNEWLWSPYQSLTNDELNEQIQRLQNPNEKVARELYKARYGKDYAEPKRPQSKWGQFIGNKEEANYRTETGRWAEAVLDASRIEELENPEIVAQRKDRYARLMQEKMWRNRQEVIPAVGEQITELQQRILTNPKQDGIDMNGAKHLLNKTIDLYNAPSKYGKGNGFVNWGKGLIDQITDYDTWTAGVTDVARMANINGIVNKMNKQEQLTNEEELVLEAFLLSSAVQDVRSDLSAGYTAGKGAAESIPFMAEMFLTAGAGAAAKKGIVTLAERKLGQAFADKLARSLGGTIIKDAAGNVVERGATKTMAGKVSKTLAYDFVQTAAMPSTYAKLYQDRVDEILKGDGDFDFLDFTRSFAGSMVETGTERWGGKIIDKGMEKIIPFNAKALWGNNKAFGEFVENYIQSPAGETGEEVIGAAVNTLRSFNPLYNNADENSISNNANLRGELGEMLTPEGLGQTFLTILPMSVFGGSTNLGFNKAYAKYSISNYTKQKEALRQLLQDNGATGEQANRIISQIESSEDDKAFVDKLQMAYDNLVNKHLLENTNESKEDLVKFQNNLNKVLGEYAKSAGRYNTVIGKLQDAYKDLSDKEKAKIDNAMANYMNSVAQTVVDKHIEEEQKTEQEGEQKGENAKQGQPKKNPAPQGEVPIGGEQGDKPAPVGEQGENKGEPAKPKTTNKPQQLEKRAIDIEVNGTPMRVVVSGTAVIEEDGSIDFTNKKNRVYIQQTDGRPAARQEIKDAVNTKLREEKAAQKTPVEQTEPTPSAEEKEGAEEVVPPTPPVVETPQGGESVVENDGEFAPKPYPTKEDGTPDFEQIGSDPDMSVAAARDMGLDESVLIDNSVARIDEEIATTQKSKKMSVLEQMARVDALEKEKARWENLRKKEENAENPTESLDNQKENSNFADEGGQQNDTGRIPTESTGGSNQNVETGQGGDGVLGGTTPANAGVADSTPNTSNLGRSNGGSLSNNAVSGQQNDTGGIQGQGSTGGGENVELGRQGQSVHGEAINDVPTEPVGREGNNNPDPLETGSLPDVSITDQLDEQNSSIDNLLQAKGIRATPKKVVRVTAQSFHDAIAQGKVHNTMGWCVDVHDVTDYENDICLLTEDGQAGIAITPDGDIISLFSNGNGGGVANKLIPMAIAMGGRKADFYMTNRNNGLQNIYARFGAKVVAQTPFSEPYMRDNNSEWVEYENKLSQKYISEGLSEEEAREKAHAEAIDHPLGACIFPATAEEAIEFKAQNPQYTVDMDKVEKFEGENGYGDMMEHRDKELEKEKQQPKTEQKEEKPQKKQKTDLRGNDIVLLYSPTRQEYVWARKETDGNGNTKYYRVDTGRPFRANVDEGYKGEDGKWVFDKTYKTRQTVKTYQNPHGELKEFETTAYVNLTNKFGGNRIVYLKNGDTYTPYMLQSPFSLDELKNGKTASGRTIGQKIVLMPLQTYGNVVDGKQSATYRLYVENENGEKVPLTKGQENHTGSIEVQSPNGALETVLFENNKAGIRITLADILATPIYTQKRKKTVKDKNGVEHKEDTSGTTQTQVLTTIKLQLQKQFSKLRNDELVAAGDAEMAAKEIQTTLGKIVKGWNEMVEERGLDKLLDEYKDNLDLTTYNKTFSNPTEISLHIPQEGNTAALIKNIKVVMDLAGKLQEELELDDRTNDYLFEEGVYPQVNLDFVRIGSRNEIPTLKKNTTKTKDETATPEQQDKTGATEQKPTAYRIPNSDDIAKLDYLQDQIDRAEYDGRYDDYVEAVKQYNKLYDTFDFSNEKEETRPQRVVEKSQQQFIDDNMSFQRGGTVARAVTPAQRFVTNVLLKALGRIKGITIHRATQDDVTRVLERIKRKSSLDTEIVELFGSPLKVSVISSEDGAKVLQNLESAKRKYQNDTNTKAAPSDIGQALNAIQTGNSYYATIEAKNGDVVTIRISNHNATTSNFDKNGEGNGISIVISRKPNGGIKNDGNAHVTEFFYSDKKLHNADGSPIADIIGSLEQTLYSGEYKDATGLAEVEEVNRQDFVEAQNVYDNIEQIETFETPDGTVYGWAVGNEIYLTEDGLNPETPIHEYTHLWAKAMENSDPKGWAKIVRLCKANKALWESVKNDPNYTNIKDDDNRIASEVLSRYAGEHGMEKLVQEAERMAKDGKSFESDVESKLFVSRMKNALKSFWGWVKEKLGIENLDDISNRSLHDLLNGTDLGLEELGLTTEEKHIAEKAKADGTYMQAPNGKPSNLSPKQWLQTRTGAFKEWFGDWEDSSQNKGMLLDENDEPKVVYRGSANDDFVFRSRYGEGTYWFTDNREVAEHYARRGADHELPDYELDGRIQPVFLKLGDSSTYNAEGRNWENVYNEPVYQIVDDESGNITAEFKTREEAKRYCEENGLDPEIEILESNGVTGDIAAQQFADGKTGVVFENVVDGGSVPSNVYVVRDNGQAKSATENNGGFDEGNPDIRFQIESEQTEQLLDPDEPEPLQPAKRMSWFQRKVNAMLDQSNGIRLLQKRIGEIEGKPITMDEDVREALEAKRSKIANTLERFGNHQRKHLKDALHDVQKSIRTTGLWHKGQTDYYINSTGVRSDRKVTLINVLESYLMAKDTLERISQGKDVRSKELSFRLLQQLGMSVNTPIKTQQQQADVLQKWVDEFESKIDQKQVDALWKAIDECTDFALDNLLAGEVIGKNLYDDLKQSRFYVPERGFAQLETDDDIRREVDGRKKHSGAKSTAPEALRRAHGGESMATDVIANILYLGVNSVSCAEENKVRKAAFDLLKNHQEACQELGYPSASRVWYVRDGFNEDGTPRYKAQIEKPSAEMFARNQEVRDLINGFREDMEMFNDNPEMLQYIREQIQETKKDLLIVNKRNAGGAAIDRAALAGEDIPKVLVSVATEDGDVQQYTMAFPNQREIANALNGIMSSKFRDSLLGTIGRQFSALYTTRNPSFFKNNLPKDVMFAMAKGTGERGGAYAAYFAAEMARPATTIVPILEWVTHLDVEGREAGESKWSQSLAKDGSIEREFQQFLDGGGNTGFTQMKDIAEFRKEADQLVNDPNIATKSLSFIFKSLPSAINEFSELWVRFAVYRASKAYMNTENAVIRNVGRAPSDWRRTTEYTPEEIEATALHDARNFTTNFNRHGAGGLADFFMSISMFSNASVQGAMTTWRSFEEGNYQKGVRSALSIMIVPAFIGYLVTKLRPDDEDEESKLPDFIRQNNIVFLDKRIPVSYEMIPWYRIGVNYALMQDGHISKTDGIENIAMGFAEHALPVAPALSTALKDGIDCLIPETDFSAANPDWKDVAVNLMQMQFMNGFNLYAQGKSWTGSNLRYEYAGDKPQYLYQDYEADLYKDISKALYGIKGGDFNNPSITINGKKMGNFYNASPKEIKAFIGNITPSGWVNIACYAYGLGKNLALQDGVDYVRDKDKPFSSFTIEDNPTMFRIGVARELSAMSKEAKENYTRVEGLRNMNEDDAKERIKQWDKLYSDYTALRTMEAGYKEKELKPYIRSLKHNYKIDIDSDKLEDVMHAYVMVMLQEEYDMKGISRTIDDIETWRQRYDKPRISK